MRVWIAERFDGYARACVLAAVFLTPILFSRETIDSFAIVEITVAWVLVVSGLTLWTLWAIYDRKPFLRSPILYAELAFIVVAGLATLFSRMPLISFTGLYERYGGLVSLLVYAGAMLLVAQLFWRQPEGLERICKAAAAAATIVSGYVLIQALGLDWNQLAAHGGSVSIPAGTFSNSNLTGGYLATAIPFSVYLAIRAERNGSRAAFIAITMLQVSGLWLTENRGGLLAAGTAFGLFLIAQRGRLNRVVKAVSVVVLMGIALVVLMFLLRSARQGGNDQILGLPVGTSTLGDRVDYWRGAIRVAGERPLLGTGPDTYFGYYPKYRPAAEGAKNGLELPDEPHNIFLDHAAGEGLLGVGAFSLLMSLALYRAARRTSDLQEPVRLLLITFSAALAAYLVQGFFSVDAPPLALLAWVALGAIAAITAPAADTAGRRSLPRTLRHPAGLAAGVLIVATLLVVIGMRPFIADVKGKSAQDTGNLTQALSFYADASELNPAEAEYRYLAGRLLESHALTTIDAKEQQRLFTKALAQINRAIDLKPRRVAYLTAKAQLNSKWAQADSRRLAAAERSWRLVIRLDPTNQELRSLHKGVRQSAP